MASAAKLSAEYDSRGRQGDVMKQILYVKYNKMRREPFQTRTQICEENGVRFVEKSAVRPQGIPHIRRFADSYQKMERFYEKVSMLEPAFTGDVMRYAYVEGQTLDELLEERIRSGENAAAVLSEALDKLLAIREGGRLEFERTNAFDEVFGAVKCPDPLLLLFETMAGLQLLKYST